jgi:hypothetical protein
MKYIKFALLNIIVFGGLLFLISLLFPSSVGVSKSISINSDRTKVANTIVAFENWNVYSATNNNFIVKTDSVLKVEHNSSYGNLQSLFVLEGENTVNVSWALQQQLKWYNPIQKFSAMVKEKTWIAGMDSSLYKLKQICENQVK